MAAKRLRTDTEEKRVRESRLFKIVYHLLDRGRATADELAEKFEVSTRTIYRDIEALSGAGIPVYAEMGRNGGIYLMRDYVLDKAILSEQEKQEILAALQSLNATQSIDSSGILDKLSAIFNVGSQQWLEVDFSRWGNEKRDRDTFEKLKTAIIQQRAVKMTYASSYGEISTRKIYPFRLSYQSKAWYIKAYCTEKKEYRIFKLTRILDFEILDENGPSDLPTEQKDTQDVPDREYNTIILRFSRHMAYRVYDEFDLSEIAPQENGDLLVCSKMPEDAWLVGFLLSMGTQVEIIQPVYLRDILARQALQIYEKYKT